MSIYNDDSYFRAFQASDFFAKSIQCGSNRCNVPDNFADLNINSLLCFNGYYDDISASPSGESNYF